MERIITNRQRGFPWHDNKRIFVKGYLFDQSGRCYKGDSLIEYFSQCNNEEEFSELLKKANGCYCVIIDTEEMIYCGVDVMRSMPIFYGQKGDEFYVGDDIYSIRNLIGTQEIDPVSREEFLRVGFAVGKATLDTSIFQLEAGDCMFVRKDKVEVTIQNYYSHGHRNYVDLNTETLLDDLEIVYQGVFDRLVRSAENRTIVVPLSGGYDSRAVVCGLHRAGYKNVVCFSYGVPESYEIATASKVAKQLGYPIHIIDYSAPCWKRMVSSDTFSNFCHFTSHHSAVPCIQELPALHKLNQNGMIPCDSIIVPGYGGDVQGGDFIPYPARIGKPERVLATGIVDHIIKSQYDLRTSPIAPQLESALQDRIRDYTSQFQTDNLQEFCSVMDDWMTRNKQAKYIINSVRTYEFFDYEWRLPLWDSRFNDWWYRIPVEMRTNRILYNRFLDERLFDPLGISYRKPKRVNLTNRAEKWLPPRSVQILRNLWLVSAGRLRPEPVDIDGFDEASVEISKQFPADWETRDFSNVVGYVAGWCLLNNI